MVSTVCLFLVVAGGTAYAANTVFSTDIVDGEVKTPDIAGQAVTSAQLKAGAVTTAKLANDAVTTGKVAADTLGAVDLAQGSVGTSEIAPGSVTGVHVVESSLLDVDAETLDGGSLCRTPGSITLIATGSIPLDERFVCSTGSLSLSAVCLHTPSTAVARLVLDTSADDAWVSSGVHDNPDLDAAEAPATLVSASNTSGDPGSVSTGDTSFAAGDADDALTGSGTAKATRNGNVSSRCRFVVGATD